MDAHMLAGKTAIITGASYGMGVAMAELFAAEGANVALTARGKEKLDAVVDKISEHQHDMDKELAMLGKDVRALHRRVDDHEERFTTFCQFWSNEHKGDMPADVFNLVSYGRNKRRDDE